MPSSVFVTGGSGFVGGALIRRLVADGHRVRALARSESSAAAVSALGAEPVRGDVSDAAALRAGAEGCSIAFHAAAKVEDFGPWEDFERVTVQGTRATLAACSDAGVVRFVHVSTEAVLIAGRPLVEVDESAPRRPDSASYYPRSKALAEEAVLAANRSGFETVAVRPRFVWGHGDTVLLPRLVEMAQAGKLAWIGGGRQRTDTAHVDNVAHGLVLAAERGRGGEAYFVTDGDRVVFREFVSDMLRTQGAEPPTRSIPAPVAGAVARAGEAAWRALRRPGTPPLTRFACWVSSQECTIRIDKARRELGYEPPVSRAEGLRGLAADRVGT